MENAVDALKIAFAVMVFTIALTLAISTFSQARETSEAVLFMNDKTNYYSWEDSENYSELDATGNIVYKSQRIVGIDEIIPTLYRYYKENYTVIFEGIDAPIYFLDSTGKWNKEYSGDDVDKIYYFDLNSEISRNCPWVGTVNDIKKNLDLFLKGTDTPGLVLTDEDKSFGNIQRKVKYQYDGSNGFMKAYANAKFLEELGEYSTDRTYGITKIDGVDYLVVHDEERKEARFLQNVTSNKWVCQYVDTGFSIELDGGVTKHFTNGTAYTLEEIATVVGNSASTFLDDESGEIIELAKPTIKRVIRYTLQ